MDKSPLSSAAVTSGASQDGVASQEGILQCDTSIPTVPSVGASQAADSVLIQIPSRTEWVRVVRMVILGVASRMTFTYDDVEDIKLAVSEACNNAILHAHAFHDGASDACIQVTITPYSDRLEIRVADQGQIPPPGIQPPQRPVPRLIEGTANSDELPENGLGLFLMRTLMDEVEYRTGAEQNTEVSLVKYLPATLKPAPRA
jgi:serine/threonine-protein kinase RsbW